MLYFLEYEFIHYWCGLIWINYDSGQKIYCPRYCENTPYGELYIDLEKRKMGFVIFLLIVVVVIVIIAVVQTIKYKKHFENLKNWKWAFLIFVYMRTTSEDLDDDVRSYLIIAKEVLEKSGYGECSMM